MKEYLVSAEHLIDMLGECTCQFTTVKKSIQILKDNGFNELKLNDNWRIYRGGKYYINIYDSSLFAVDIGTNYDIRNGMKIVAAHTDHPCLCIKPNPEIKKNKYGLCNVEIYGGMILNTWLDRPLSAAGKVTYRSEETFRPNTQIFDFRKSLFTIPNIAIHQNHEVNKGIELNRQKDMIPLCTIINDTMNKDNFFINYLSENIQVPVEDILDFEIYIYNNDIPEIIGLNDDFISAPRLDNITSVVAALEGIIECKNHTGFNAIALFDNEEIGSRTKQGADSSLLSMILEKMYLSLGFERSEYIDAITSGFFLSVDVAHGEHPNKMEKSDITNKNPLNNGIVIKRACSQTYGTDSESIAIIEQVCLENDIPYQKFVSRSDVSTGSTLGGLSNKYLPMRLVDVGVPILAMHSARETMGSKDQRALEKLIISFFMA